MKHIKLFENIYQEEIWHVIQIWNKDDYSISSFSNEEAAANCYLSLINDEKEIVEGDDFSEYLASIEDAEDWANKHNFYISYNSNSFRESYTLDKNLKAAVEAKKYNL